MKSRRAGRLFFRGYRTKYSRTPLGIEGFASLSTVLSTSQPLEFNFNHRPIAADGIDLSPISQLGILPSILSISSSISSSSSFSLSLHLITLQSLWPLISGSHSVIILSLSRSCPPPPLPIPQSILAWIASLIPPFPPIS